jgi:hypothetical protein
MESCGVRRCIPPPAKDSVCVPVCASWQNGLYLCTESRTGATPPAAAKPKDAVCVCPGVRAGKIGRKRKGESCQGLFSGGERERNLSSQPKRTYSEISDLTQSLSMVHSNRISIVSRYQLSRVTMRVTQTVKERKCDALKWQCGCADRARPLRTGVHNRITCGSWRGDRG